MLAILSSYLSWIKLAGALTIVAAIGYGLWSLYDAGYQAGANQTRINWNADKVRAANAEKTALLAYAAKINQAQEQHDHDQAAIDTLARHARRLRIHLPACGNHPARAVNPHGTAGLLSARVDKGFAELQARAARLFVRCDQLNIDAIRANAMRTGAGEAGHTAASAGATQTVP